MITLLLYRKWLYHRPQPKSHMLPPYAIFLLISIGRIAVRSEGRPPDPWIKPKSQLFSSRVPKCQNKISRFFQISENWNKSKVPKCQKLHSEVPKCQKNFRHNNALLNRTRCFRCEIQILKMLGFMIFWYFDLEGIFWHFRTRNFWHYGTWSFFWHVGTWPFSLTILGILWKSWSMSSCTEFKF